MKDVKDTWCIQIDITNKCENSCSNCTHLIKHTPTWEMDIKTFKKAVDSLIDFPGLIGIIGGNPVLHRDFYKFSEYFKKRIPNKTKRGLWTSGGPSYEKIRKYCEDSFSYINFNSHKIPSKHQPLLINPKDIIKESSRRKDYIDNCWLAEKWSPSINPKGCYRCEVMGAFDMVLNKNLGLPITKNWWKKPLSTFSKQISSFCVNCSIPIPLPARNDYEQIDDISQLNLELFKNSPRIKCKRYCLRDDKILMQQNSDWKPEKYRQDITKIAQKIKYIVTKKINK
jgi:hypothetical protein